MTRRHPRTARGFSLIEVMIAVVVLATGLLALAALQGTLARGSAEAKVRGRVAAMLATRMDELRGGGYGSLTPEGPAPRVTSTSADACDSSDPGDWLDCAREQAGLGSLSIDQAIDTWYGAASFANPAPTPADPAVAQFKRITLGASWTDATGDTRQLQMVSDVSSLALTNNLIPPPDDEDTGGGGPIVRTIDPATTPGVIPIVLGAGSESATSNPIPELVGQRNNQQIVGTRFTAENYTAPQSGAVIVTKRFENEVIKCSCRYGAGGNNLPLIYRTALWPAIWTGERYDLFEPSPQTAAPGQARSSGPTPGVEQSPLCQECCRDHHDNEVAGVARFDPERRVWTGTGSNESTGHEKYNLTNQGALQIVNNTNNGQYVDACRVIRVDGFWRTAADMYSRKFGLLETESVGGAAARTGVPTSSAVTAYTGFVTDYLKQYDGSTGAAPGNAQSLFDGTSGINVPAMVTIAQPSNTDYRYLHGRGLYVDYLEEKARAKLAEVLADTDPQGRCPSGTPVQDCVMPYLPFITANLTEIAKWTTDAPGVLAVNSGNLLATNPAQPSGSRTLGKAAGTAGNTGTMRLSNSGVAVNAVMPTLGGVDPLDDGDVDADMQPFTVNGGSAGPTFDVRVSGGGANPFVFFTLGNDADRECLKPAGGDHHCVTSAGTVLPQSGSIRVANYWIETTPNQPQQVTATCSGQTATDMVKVPLFRNYAVTAATIGGVAGSIGTPLNDNKTSESTTISFGSIAANALVTVTLAEQTGSPTYATIASCTINNGKISNIVWNKPWTQP